MAAEKLQIAVAVRKERLYSCSRFESSRVGVEGAVREDRRMWLLGRRYGQLARLRVYGVSRWEKYGKMLGSGRRWTWRGEGSWPVVYVDF